MRRPSASHHIDCDPATFWSVFWDDDAFLRELYLEVLQFKSFTVVSRSETKRVMRLVPKMNVPGPVAKVIGDTFGYEDHAELDRGAGEMRWQMKPNTMQGKLLVQGMVRVTPDGDGCRRVDEVTIEAKIFGVGGLVEGSTEQEVRAGWDKEAAFLKRYLARRAQS
ncbi:MAG: DUF2505 domain-containing protein [Myxococcales bacterium]|nr:DUF2505 domain-containing protein [Myxococcales bacterium]